MDMKNLHRLQSVQVKLFFIRSERVENILLILNEDLGYQNCHFVVHLIWEIFLVF